MEDVGYLSKYLEDAMGGDVFDKTTVDACMAMPLIF